MKEYIGSFETEYGLRHGLTKYTLSTGAEIILNEDEIEELFKGSRLGRELENLQAENQKVTYQRDYYKGLIRTFTSTLNEMKGV